MSTPNITRRNFLSAMAATGAATMTDFTPAANFNGDDYANIDAVNREIKIVSTHNFSEKEQEAIRTVSKNINFKMAKDAGAAVEEAEVILGDADASTLQRAKKLKWVQVMHAGVENMPKEMVAHPLVLTNMQKVLAPVIAENAIALLLSLTRGLAQFAFPNFAQRKWDYSPPADVVLDDLYNKTIGIVGMGGIGSETARRLHYGFNMRVLGTDAKPMHPPEFVEELHDPTWFMEMVPKVDVLMSAAPLTPLTRKMFNEEVFSKMKPTAYFINVSRGGLVDQPALVAALKSRKIRGAGLDVATPEPLPADNPLWDLDNVALTAHNSTVAPVRQQRVMALLLDNVRRYSSGLPLKNVVDKEKGY